MGRRRNMKDKAVIMARASSSKQAIQGDTLEDQILQCERYIASMHLETAKRFPLVETGRKIEREYFEEVLTYCENPKNNIGFIVFKNISRFTRQGGVAYKDIKDRMSKVGVKLRDIYGTIGEEVNTLESFGLEYDWSKYSPSENSEIHEADKAKDYVRDSLTQMIGAEIGYVRKGYWNRRPPYGFQNKKIDTADDGERNILVPEKLEAGFVKKMYALRCSRTLDDQEIVDKLNSLGYLSRERKQRDRRTRKVVGKNGKLPLTVKQFQKYLSNPIYAGVICEKWTLYKPLRAKFPGLVTIDVFNDANLGKIRIVESGTEVHIQYGENLTANKSIKRRSKSNPLYPYRGIVMCPVCSKPITGSASKGQGGKTYPAYHCSRGHKLWRVRVDELHAASEKFVGNLKFNDRLRNLFEDSFIHVWEEKRKDVITESHQAEEYVSSLLVKQKAVLDTISTVSSPVMKKGLEEQFDELEATIQEARNNRVIKEKKELDVKTAVKYSLYLMEHSEELLINTTNPMQKREIFSLFFNKLPTYNDLLNGTADLSPIFSLNTASISSKSSMVTLRVMEPNSIIANLLDLFDIFSPDLSRLDLAISQ